MADPSMESNIEVQGINYYTLLEPPDANSTPASTNDDLDQPPCVLLVHALMSNMHMWDATAKALHAAGYATLRYDHVGHHNTPPAHVSDLSPSSPVGGRRDSISLIPANSAYHMDDLARHMHQLVKTRLGSSRRLKAVIGCSIGGVLALRYAMLFPGDVERVISIAAPGIAAPPAAKDLWTQRIALFEQDMRDGTDKLCHATVERWFPGGRAEDDEVRAESLRHVKTCGIQGYKVLADAIRDYDYAAEVASIGEQGTKCLVVAGSEDAAASPEHLREVAGKIKGGEYFLMKGAGHLPPMHQAERFNVLMLRFLGQD